MFDFKPGDVLESRKGGANTLRHLAQELATLERNGSILIELVIFLFLTEPLQVPFTKQMPHAMELKHCLKLNLTPLR